MKLSKEQLQVVDLYLKDKKVKNWDVRYEIVDHMACLTEGLMEEGNTFDGAIVKMKQMFTFRYLRDMQMEKQKALSRQLRKGFVAEFKTCLFNSKFLIKVLALALLTIVFYQYVSVNSMIGVGFVLLYSPMFFQIKGMIKNFQLYGKSMLMSKVWIQLLGLPNVLMLPIHLNGDVIMDKYGMVMLIVVLCLIPVMLVWNSLLLREMRKLKEQYFLIYK